LKNSLIEETKERANLEQQKKALIAENGEVKNQLSSLRTESSAIKLALQAKIAELTAKCESQAKEVDLLQVESRKAYVYQVIIYIMSVFGLEIK
jgi:hypothetical protein